MKKFGVTIACALFMFSCAQDDNLTIAEQKSEVSVQTSLTTVEAQTEFAKILSKALSGSEAVRSFLREEAMARFDNDNDVFYPFVKNKIVPGAGGMTFRDVLLSYCDDETRLKSVESALPLLNILVPDLTLFWDFNAQKWDVTEDEVAVLCRDDQTNSLYEDGENIGQLETGDVPGFPCLVVKNNERLRVNPAATRSVDGVGYEFISDAYDGSKRPAQTRHYDTDLDLEPTEDVNAYLSASQILESVRNAYAEFKGHPTACQRDYIYYGQTKDQTTGILNKNIAEKLYRFRINPAIYSNLTNSSADPKLTETAEYKRFLTNEEIIKRVWTEGAFEFHFYFLDNNENRTLKFTYSVTPQELFSMEKVHLHHRNSTAFRSSRNAYHVEPQYLRSKWVYIPNAPVFAQPWDLKNRPTTIYVHAEEYDQGETQTHTETHTFEHVSETTVSTTTEGSDKTTVKHEYGTKNTITETGQLTVVTTVTSNDLGTLRMNFSDPIITNEKSGTYAVRDYSFGDLVVTFLPVDTSK